jgi:hypothetical protein
MIRLTRWLVGSIVVIAFVAGPALAQGYPPGAQTVEVSDSTVNPCETITVSGENLVPGITVQITFDSQVIGSAVVGADGTYSTTVQIPCEAAPGTHVLSAGGVSTEITGLAAGGAGGAAFTGTNLGAGILIMSALFVVGVIALVATQRRARLAQPQRAKE